MITLQTAVDALDAAALSQATALAEAQAMPFHSAWSALVGEFVRRAKQRSPEAVEIDGRSARWRVRVRLYSDARPSEPEADSDPDLPADRAGAMVVSGLPGVATVLREMAEGFHMADCQGLDDATLLHRLKSLRPTLSRRGGNAVWRVPYEVWSQRQPRAGVQVGQPWLARVDVERVES